MKTKIIVIIIAGFLLFNVFTLSAIRKTGSQGDYFPMNNFKLEIDGIIVAGFKEISGIESETGIDPRINVSTDKKIVLKRGFVNDPALKEWFDNVLNECELFDSGFKTFGKKSRGYTITCAPQNERKSGSIIVLDRSGQEVMRYNFYEAWPTKWKAPSLDSKGDTHMIEELELAIERIEKA